MPTLPSARARGGFTLVEFLVSCVAYGLLVLVAGITLVSLSAQLHRGRSDLEAQRDLGVARHRITYALRGSARAQVQVAAGRLEVQTASGTVVFAASGSNLVQRTAGGEETTLVGGRLLQFQARLTNFAVEVTLAVRGGDITNAVWEPIAFRNGP